MLLWQLKIKCREFRLSDILIIDIDLVTIQIKNKLGRLTQKDMCRHKLRPTSSRKTIDPMCIDASQYDFNNPLATNSCKKTNGGDSSESVSDAESAKSMADLIDLTDELPYRPQSSANQQSPTIAATKSSEESNPTFVKTQNHVRTNNSRSGNASASTLLPSLSSSLNSTMRDRWETFD